MTDKEKQEINRVLDDLARIINTPTDFRVNSFDVMSDQKIIAQALYILVSKLKEGVS